MLKVTKKTSQAGFTVMEIVIVAPIVLTTITGLAAAIMFITTNVMQLGQANQQRQAILSAFSLITDDLSVTSQIKATSFPSPDPQDHDQPFQSTDNQTLIINRPLIHSHLRDKNKDLIWVDSTTNDCSGELTPSEINVVYFLEDKTLWRRVLLPNNWQGQTYCFNNEAIAISKLQDQPSCSITNEGGCQVKDSKILTEVTKFKAIKTENLLKITLATKDQTITKQLFINSD